MTMFIIFGLLMSVFPVGIVIARNIYDSVPFWKWVVELSIGFAIGFGLVGLIFADHAHDEKLWNNGYCECGGEWDLVSASHVRNGGDRYYYECEECRDTIEIGFSGR